MKISYTECDCCRKKIEWPDINRAVHVILKTGKWGGKQADFCPSCWDRIVKEAKMDLKAGEKPTKEETRG